MQRENLLPSERASLPTKMKLEAIKHQGARTPLDSVQVEQTVERQRPGGKRSRVNEAVSGNAICSFD